MAEAPPFVLSVDLDGVVADYETAFREFVARERGVEPGTLPPQDAWSFVNSGWGFESEEDFLETHHRAVVHGGLFIRMQMIKGASDALWELNDLGVHIRLTTARLMRHGADLGHATAISDTVRWLDINNIPFRDLLLLHDKHSALAGLALHGKRVVHIDDSPGQITAVRDAGVPVVAMDQLYNRHITDVPRVSGWGEMLQLVKDRLSN